MNTYTMPTKQQALKYMHQTLFCPPIPTLIAAIENEQLRTFPHLTVANVRTHLEPILATAKGRIRMNKQGIHSTRKLHESPTMPVPQANHVFCFAAMADKTKRTLYHDLTGRLPVMFLESNQYFLVAYDYTLNAILVQPTKNLKSATVITAFDSIFQELKEKGFKPQRNITDNQAVTALKAYLHAENCEWQFVESNNHHVNAAEQAIQTFKNHFISGLCTTDKDFPLQLWDHMTAQAQDILNLLRTSRHDPTKSAYKQLNGPYDFNKWPMAPPGTNAVIWENPTRRQSWAPRGLNPSKDHYQLYKFYCPETQAIRVNGSAQFFPQHCKLPTLSPTQHANTVADELFESLANLKKEQMQTNPSQNRQTTGSHRHELPTNTSKGDNNKPHGCIRTEGGGHPRDHQHIHESDGPTHCCHNPKDPSTNDTSQYPRAHSSYQERTRSNHSTLTPCTSAQPTTRHHRLSDTWAPCAQHHFPRGCI
jgi:hypothetical protein